MIKLKIFCYDPSSSVDPCYEEVCITRTDNMRVLDALNSAYETLQHRSLAHRWFCGTKKCGECAITVNGKPVLACWEAASDEMTCEPISNFPIIRDLVVDTARYERDIIMKLRPWMERPTVPTFPEKVSHQRMRAAHSLSKCIECNVCSAAIPVEGVTPAGIQAAAGIGAAALVRFTRFLLDPRDQTNRHQLAETVGMRPFPNFSVLKTVCPQGIDILDEAVVPANRILFSSRAESQVEDDETTTIFVRSQNWSAFIRIDPQLKPVLVAAGTLTKADVPMFSEVYDLLDTVVDPKSS